MRSNQSIPKEISPEYSLEGLMLKLKLQYFDPLMQRANSLEKSLMLGKIENKRRRGDRRWAVWMALPTQWTWVWARDSEVQGSLACVQGVTKSQTWLTDSTTTATTTGSSVHGISQARILEWITVSFSRGSSEPRDWTCISWIAGGLFTTEPPGKPKITFARF